jgi:hypothetical protein
MKTRLLLPALALLATGAFVTANAAMLKWPPWISIESPVNPFDASARGAVMLVHATFREGPAQLSDLSGTAEGLVNGARRTIPLRFDDIGRPNTFALRRQWPAGGAWLVRISLKSTTAIVTFDNAGNVASVRVPVTVANGQSLPREVAAREIDSTLTEVARR